MNSQTTDDEKVKYYMYRYRFHPMTFHLAPIIPVTPKDQTTN